MISRGDAKRAYQISKKNKRFQTDFSGYETNIENGTGRLIYAHQFLRSGLITGFTIFIDGLQGVRRLDCKIIIRTVSGDTSREIQTHAIPGKNSIDGFKVDEGDILFIELSALNDYFLKLAITSFKFIENG